MYVVIGPVLTRNDKYRFDMWAADEGTIPGYSYRRIEDAYYARNATIKAFAAECARAPIVCQTLDAFVARANGYDMHDDAARAFAVEPAICRSMQL
jgi:hypothetical protein